MNARVVNNGPSLTDGDSVPAASNFWSTFSVLPLAQIKCKGCKKVAQIDQYEIALHEYGTDITSRGRAYVCRNCGTVKVDQPMATGQLGTSPPENKSGISVKRPDRKPVI